MQIKLDKLVLQNFKGVKEFTLTPGGNSIDVWGDNATGKTTLIDAFLWLLFNKDSQGRADFEIKAIKDGQQASNLDHSVEAWFLVNDARVELKKTYKEKWIKKRGAVKPEFTGHETKYHVNGVPAKKKEYQEATAKLIDESTFRLLTDPRHFNQLPWQDRRQILLTVCGDVADDVVMDEHDELKGLAEILGNHSIEDQKKIIAEKRRKINDELKEIPARIDELVNSLPEPADLKTLQHDLGNIKQEIIALEQLKQGASADMEKAQIKAKIAQLKAEQQTVLATHHNSINTQAIPLEQEITDKNNAIYTADKDKLTATQNRNAAQIQFDRINRQMADEREKWHIENKNKFEWDDVETCPTCNHPIPAEQIKDARDAAQETFNKIKASTLEKINKAGKELKAKAEELEKNIAEFDQQIEEKSILGEKLKGDFLKAEQKLKEIRNTPTPEKYQELAQEIAELEKKLEKDQQTEPSEYDAQIVVKKQLEETINDAIVVEKHRQKSMARVAELEEKEKALAVEFEDLESQLNLIDRFIVAKVNMLEEKINSKFELTKFKLFEIQINGGVNEICVATDLDGVPWPSLNNAARVNIGIDCINILSNFYDVSAPIWVDNAEAVTSYIETQAQVIKLSVSEQHKKLTIK